MPLDYSIHRNIQLQILKEIYTDTKIAPFLGFKGGTAAFMFYNLNRFSVDLDFDLIGEINDKKEKEIFARVLKIAQGYGKIKEAWIKRYNLFIVFSYKERTQSVKIEINRRRFGSRYEAKTLLGISMLVMRKDDMFANKLMAMIERVGRTSRDIFDVYFFLKNNWPINKKIVEERTNVSFEAAVKKGIKLLEKLNNKRILDGLGEFLSASQKDWARTKLKEETIFLLKARLASES